MAEARRLFRLAGVAAAVVASVGLAAPMASASAEGNPEPTIIGGQPTTIEENPFMVTVKSAAGSCGGSIVAPNKVVTAAHCTDGAQPGDVTVIAGRTNYSEPGTTVGVTNVWVHPEWVADKYQNDASVLTLDAELPQAPLALATPEDTALYEPGANSTVLGWGVTENGQTSEELRKVDLPVVSDQDCTGAYQDGYDPASMVCAGVPEGGVDSCQGDSGGPLVAAGADGTRKMIGIVSWGEGCAEPGKYGVYGRVGAFHALLQEQIGA